MPSDAARLVLDYYNRMVAAGRGREFYGSVGGAIWAAAERAVYEKLLEAKDVESAVEEAIKFIVRDGRDAR